MPWMNVVTSQPARLISIRLDSSEWDWWARLRARTAPFQWSEPLGKGLAVGLLHVGHGVVQGIRNKAGKRAMAGPIDGVPEPFEQRDGQGDRDPLFPRLRKRRDRIRHAVHAAVFWRLTSHQHRDPS